MPTPLEDAIANMAALDALFASARSGTWSVLISKKIQGGCSPHCTFFRIS